MTALIRDLNQAAIDKALAVFKNAHIEFLKLDYRKLFVAKEVGEALLPLLNIPDLDSNRAITRLLIRAGYSISTRTVDDYIFVATFWDDIVKAVGDKLEQIGYKKAIQMVREQAKLLTYVRQDDGWREEHGGFNRTYPSGRFYAVHPTTFDAKPCWMLNGDDIPEKEWIDAEPFNGPVLFFPTSAAAKAKADELERLDRRIQPVPAQPDPEPKEIATEATHDDDPDPRTKPRHALPQRPKEDPAILKYPAALEAQDAVIENADASDSNDEDDVEQKTKAQAKKCQEMKQKGMSIFDIADLEGKTAQDVLDTVGTLDLNMAKQEQITQDKLGRTKAVQAQSRLMSEDDQKIEVIHGTEMLTEIRTNNVLKILANPKAQIEPEPAPLSNRIRIERAWAMPSKNTFSIKPIRLLIEQEKTLGLWIDPFPFPFKQDALEYLAMFKDGGVAGCLFDPPYSPRQLKECYDSLGQSLTDATSGVWCRWKDAIARVIEPGGKVISFGWSSNGLGRTRGFTITRILLVAHGGNHNDTICTVEEKVGSLWKSWRHVWEDTLAVASAREARLPFPPQR